MTVWQFDDIAVPCDGEDTWAYNPHSGLLRHKESHRCLRVTRTPLKLWLVECDQRDSLQKWYFTNFDDQGLFVSQEAAQDTTARTDL